MELTDEDVVGLATINPDNLVAEMEQAPAQLALYVQKLAEANRQLALCKLTLDQVESQVFLTCKQQGEEASGKKPSDKVLDAQVKCDDLYVQAKLRYIEAEAAAKRLDGLCRSLHRKCDMLTSLGSRINAEIRANPMAALQARANNLSNNRINDQNQ